MQTNAQRGALDRFRVAAALLVVAIHTSPLSNSNADFFLTRALARVAVPYFLMLTGAFSLQSRSALIRFSKKNLALYALCIALYLPVGLRAGHYAALTPVKALRMLALDGTFYHLWYFPASLTGAWIAFGLCRLRAPLRWTIAAALYLFGLLGDSWHGLALRIPVLKAACDSWFYLSYYTRNGLFMAPLFMLLGRAVACRRTLPGRVRCAVGMFTAFAAMTAEAFSLRAAGWMRHDSMYLALPAVCACLFALLWQTPCASSPRLRRMSLWIYALHPAFIAALHALGLTGETPMPRFLAVSALSVAAAEALSFRIPRTSPAGRAWIEIDLSALEHNVRLLRSKLPDGCALMPAVKANAYGHGAVLVAKALWKMGVRAFCVATAAEGAELRRHGVRGEILILGYTSPEELSLVRFWKLTQTVVDEGYAQMLANYGKKLRVHVALDTGMHRLGVPHGDIDALERVFSIPNLRIRGMFTHLCTSDESSGRAFSLTQIDAFRAAIKHLTSRGIRRPKLHLLASGGILNYPEFAEDAARAGIALYGFPDKSLKPVLTLKARVASVRTLHAGESAGYGQAFTAARETRIAALTIGYADGVPRALSGRGRVLLNGAFAPIVGRICMDQLLIDATNVPHPLAGDAAVLIGCDGSLRIGADEWARQCDTIVNEILSRLGPRLPRIARSTER